MGYDKIRMTFSATGDSFITRRLPPNNASYEEVKNIIKKAEARFTNLEVTVHNYEGFPSALSGGTWAIAAPEVLNDIKDYGFNLITWANNHTLDYTYGGLEATERYLNQFGFVHAGVGKNLASAGAPRYLDCPSGRVALIAATSSFHEYWAAGEQRSDIIGRPGVNPLRFSTTYKVTSEEYNHLKRIAEAIEINAYDNLIRKEGFLPELDENVFMFGKYTFVKSDHNGVITEPVEKDMQRIINSISQARRRADYVIVSIHSHQIKGESKAQPADFLVTAARKCIDAGANAFIGHGPHILRGIEIYKGCPIFYSLGNFIFQSETVSSLPADFYEKYGLGHYDNVVDALDKRSGNGTKGLAKDPNAWKSVIPIWTMEDGDLREIELYPIELGYGLPGYRSGWPVLSKDDSILENLNELCKPFNVDIKIKDNIGLIKL
jgi:poly-gamma-glutamate capsule biosynthesis protein CapA/YwtB (metallophosphatase superfamily)